MNRIIKRTNPFSGQSEMLTHDEAIAKALDDCTKKIGIAWVVDTSKIKQIASK